MRLATVECVLPVVCHLCQVCPVESGYSACTWQCCPMLCHGALCLHTHRAATPYAFTSQGGASAFCAASHLLSWWYIHPACRSLPTSLPLLLVTFLQAFPQAKWRELVPETVMNKFAESRGGSFPAPQYSNGLTMALDTQGPEQHAAGSSKALKGTGVALIGDAAHCFPPDLGGCGGF